MRSYDRVIFYLETEKGKGGSQNFCMPFACGSFTVAGRWYKIERIDREEFDLQNLQRKDREGQKGTEKEERKVLYIDGDRLENVVIRTKLSGDRFCKFSGGTKSLKGYFVDKKIDSHRRESLPLLAKGQEILAIFGVEIARALQVTEKTERIIALMEE